MSDAVRAQLAPTGRLRAAINLSNFLLVTGKTPSGDPVGVAPDMAAEIGRRLGVPVDHITYKTPGELADAVESGVWDIGLIGAEPQRAEKITFTPAYVEIESTYLVPPGSSIQSFADVDRAGIRVAVTDRTAYGLWLDRNIKHATLVKTDTLDSSYDVFVAQKLEALAGLRPKLISEARKMPGSRILEGKFAAVQQAIGTAKANSAGAQWLTAFVGEVTASGFVAGLIAKHHVEGLSVARGQ